VEPPSGDPFLAIDAVVVSVDLASLLGDEIHVSSVRLHRPRVTLDVRAGRIVNLPGVEIGAGGEGGRSVFLEALSVEGGRVRASVEDTAPWPARVDLGNLDVVLTGERNEVFDVSLRAGRGEITAGEVTRSLDVIEARAVVDLSGDASRVYVEGLHLSLLDVMLYAGDARIAIPSGQGDATASARLDVSLPLSILHPLLTAVPVMEGTASCRGEVEWAGGMPDVKATCAGRDVVVQDRTVGDLDTRVTLAGSKLEVRGARIRQPGAVASLDGSLALGSEELDVGVELQLRILRSGPLAEGLGAGEMPVAFSGGARVSVQGTLAPFDLSGRLEATAADVERTGGAPHRGRGAGVVLPEDPVRLSTLFAVNDRALAFSETRIESDDTLIRAEGRVELDGGLDVRVVSRRLDSRELVRLPGVGLRAVGKVRASVKGSLDAPVVRASLALSRLDAAGVRLGRVSGTLTYRHARGRVDVAGVRGRAGGSRWRVPEATVLVRPRRRGGAQVRASVVAEEVFASDIVRMLPPQVELPEGLEGRLAGRFEVEAEPQARPARVRVDAQATVEDLAVGGQGLGAATVDATWDSGRLDIRTLALSGGPARVSVRGGISREGGLDLSVHVRDVEPELVTVVDLAGRGIAFDASLDAEVGGTLERPEVDRGLLLVTDVVARGEPLGDSSVAFTVEEDELRLEGLLMDGRFDVLSTTRTSGRLLTHTVVTFSRLYLGPEELRPFVTWDAQGLLTGAVEVGMYLRGGFEIGGRVDLLEAEASIAGYRLGSDGPLRLRFDRREVVFERVELSGEGTWASVTGRVGRAGADVDVDGRVNLALFGGFIEPVERLDGELDVAFALRGPWDDPRFDGHIDVSAERLVIADLPVAMTDMTGSARVTKAGVKMDLSGRAGEGGFEMSGTMIMEKRRPGPYTLDLDFNDLVVTVMEGTPVGLEGALVLEGDAGSEELPVLRGDVWVTHLRYTRDIEIATGERFQGVRAPTEVAVYEPGDAKVALDVELHGSEDLRVANNVIEARFRLDESMSPFLVTGTDARPVVTGVVRIIEGTVTWRDHEFEVDHGVIKMDQQAAIEPRFKVIATGGIRDWDLRLEARGTPEDFKVYMSSTPYLDDEDILCLLAFGMTCAEAEEGMGAAGLIGLTQILGQFRPQQLFEVGTRYNPETGEAEPVITIEEEITEKLSVAALTTLGTDQPGQESFLQAVVAYDVNDNVTVQGTWDNEGMETAGGLGNIGFDVSFHFEF
jgi:hypothetical protein